MVKVYIGYDPRDELAFRACVASLRKYATIDVDIIPLKDHDVRATKLYWRGYHVEGNGQMFDNRDGKPFSTQFSFTRFAVPLIDKGDEWVVFMDADMLWLSDIAELLTMVDHSKAVMCVKHNHQPPEVIKMDGVIQSRYTRKNWSSLMIVNPSKCTISPYILNNETGSFLHGMFWQADEDIGGLSEEWNWLEGWSDIALMPKIVHYTRGTPDMLGDNLPFAQEWWDAVKSWEPGMNRNGLAPNQ